MWHWAAAAALLAAALLWWSTRRAPARAAAGSDASAAKGHAAAAARGSRAGSRSRADPTACIPTAQDLLRIGTHVRLLDWRVVDNEFAVYRLSVRWGHSSWEVHRRFSDFSRLRRELVDAAAPAALPALPSRTLTRRLGSDFLEARRSALQDFIDAVMRLSEVVDKDEMRVFLGVPPLSDGGAGEGEGAHASTGAGGEDGEDGGAGSGGGGGGGGGGGDDEAEGDGNTVFSFVPEHKGGEQLRGMWSEADPATFKVRGRAYMRDGVKQVHSAPAAGRLVHLELLSSPTRADHVASRRPHIVEQCRHLRDAPFLFIVNLQVPGSPWLMCVLYFAIPAGAGEGAEFDRLLGQYSDFSAADGDDFRNERFKIIPSVVEGPMLVRSVVPQKPALLGRKLTQRYFRGSNYVETDVDIASSSIAAGIVGLCKSSASALVVDIAILLEGRAAEELPERIIGAVRFNHINLGLTEPLTL